jgi:hypothetical protein
MATDDTIVSYEYPEDYRKGREDASFYAADYNGHELVATVTCGEHTVRIYCDGEMRYHKWTSIDAKNNGEDATILRYSDRLNEAGITNDKQLYAAMDIDLIEVVNNPWFDLYDDRYGHLDCVCDTLEDALFQAARIVETCAGGEADYFVPQAYEELSETE